MKEQLSIIVAVSFLTGCVALPQPKPTIGVGTGIGIPQSSTHTPIGSTIETSTEENHSAYGSKPQHYQRAIKNYFSSKLTRGDKGHYRFGSPKRAYKKKGLAYGGALAWKGWLVETLVSTPTRTGRYFTPKPYMVLFKGNQIVEHILGNSHKLLIKVDK